MTIFIAIAAWFAASVLVGVLWGLFCRVGSGERREAGAIGAILVAGSLAVMVAVSMAGCVHNRDWKELAMQCDRDMEAVAPAVISCAAHMKKDHPGHYLEKDGNLGIRTR